MGGIAELLNANHQSRLLPQAFQVVVVSKFGGKDVDNHRTIVQENPARVRFAFYTQPASTSVLGPFFHLVDDGLKLRSTVCASDHKVIRQQ